MFTAQRQVEVTGTSFHLKTPLLPDLGSTHPSGAQQVPVCFKTEVSRAWGPLISSCVNGWVLVCKLLLPDPGGYQAALTLIQPSIMGPVLQKRKPTLKVFKSPGLHASTEHPYPLSDLQTGLPWRVPDLFCCLQYENLILHPVPV